MLLLLLPSGEGGWQPAWASSVDVYLLLSRRLALVFHCVMEWLDIQLVSQIATASTATASTTYEDEWLDVCEVARTSGRAAHRVAGTVAALKHCSRMRLSQRLKIPKVAPHVLKRIDKHNRLASRGTDIIDISEKKAKKIKGSGAYKRLTSSAVLRVCFGVKCFTAPQSLSRKGKTPGPGSTNVTGATPLAASTRSTAEWFGASHLHCQKVRNAMACCVFQHQQQVAKPDSQVSEAIIKLAFDETELYSKISGSSERGFSMSSCYMPLSCWCPRTGPGVSSSSFRLRGSKIHLHVC